jgi:hypothetical protein
MKHNLYNQFSPIERAQLLLDKYSLQYVKDTVNGNIEQAKKNTEIDTLNYWNEVSLSIKSIMKL